MKRTLMAALLASAALAACGGDDDGGGDGGGGDSGKTKAEYLAEVDAICREAERQIDEKPEPQSAEDLAVLLRETKEQVSASVQEAKEVDRPDDEAFSADLDSYYAEVEEGLERIDPVIEAAEAGDEQEVGRLAEEAEQQNREASRQAKALGFKQCSSG